jgi:hypothetical protein
MNLPSGLMHSRSFLFLLLLILGSSAFQCPRKMQKINQAKIQFDYSTIDDHGLRNGEVAVDYEFCIPADTAILEQVLKIDQGVRVMKSSKGRIGCTDQQWLCINNTHNPDWKKKLYAIASLSYVERIAETFYE